MYVNGILRQHDAALANAIATSADPSTYDPYTFLDA